MPDYKNVAVSPNLHQEIMDVKRLLDAESVGEVVELAIHGFYRIELDSMRAAREAARQKAVAHDPIG